MNPFCQEFIRSCLRSASLLERQLAAASLVVFSIKRWFAPGLTLLYQLSTLQGRSDRFMISPSGPHRCRKKLLGVSRTRTVTILPRSPPVAERRTRTRRRKHHDYRSNYSAIHLEVKHGALNNSYPLFLIPSSLGEKSAARISMTTAISHVESENFSQKIYCEEELLTLIAA